MKGLDLYTLKARVAPVMIVALPLVLTAVCWRADELAQWQTVWSIILASGGGILLGEFGRTRGKALELKLYASWGGRPTTRMLRWRSSTNLELLKRYRRNIGRIVPDVQMPTEEQEAKDPATADSVYDAVTKTLISKTRNKRKYDLVFKENCSYGFRRNLWGLKPYGAIVTVLALVVTATLILMDLIESRQMTSVETLQVACLAVASILAYAWLCVIKPSWIRVAADAYAERLLEATEVLAGDTRDESVRAHNE